MPIKLIFGALISAAVLTSAVESAADEYHVKGAFVLNFAKFVEWPPEVFKTSTDPIVICVLGENPFGPGFDKAAEGTLIASRPVRVKYLSDAQQAGQCQIAFVSASQRKLSKLLLMAAQNGSILTVGESEGFTASGGVIGFKLDGDKIRIEISTAAADRAKLHISAKLLSLALAAGKK